jgi:hypothetical protein
VIKTQYEGGITDREELHDAIEVITTPAEAKAFLDYYARRIYEAGKKLGYDKQRAMQCAMDNIGYVIGYGVPKEAKQAFADLGCSHTIFGMVRQGRKTPGQRAILDELE